MQRQGPLTSLRNFISLKLLRKVTQHEFGRCAVFTFQAFERNINGPYLQKVLSIHECAMLGEKHLHRIVVDMLPPRNPAWTGTQSCPHPE